MFIYLNKKGQNTLEYAIIIAVIVAALIAMQSYIKRGIQGKLKASTDDVGEQFSAQNTSGTYQTQLNANSSENISGGAQSTSTTTTNQNQTRTENENIGDLQSEWWP
jgi:Flp pilus assembly pilin Flp